MGAKVQNIIDMVALALKYDSADKTKIYNPMSLAYYDICELTDWLKLRKTKVGDFSGSAITMPEGTIGVTNIVSDANGPYWQIEQENILPTNGVNLRWHYVSTPEGTDLTNAVSVQIIDTDGDPATDSTVIHYWAYPPEITEADAATQEILLPDARLLALKTIVDMIGLIDHDEDQADRYRNEYQSALAAATAKNQSPTRYIGGKR